MAEFSQNVWRAWLWVRRQVLSTQRVVVWRGDGIDWAQPSYNGPSLPSSVYDHACVVNNYGLGMLYGEMEVRESALQRVYWSFTYGIKYHEIHATFSMVPAGNVLLPCEMHESVMRWCNMKVTVVDI